MDKNDFTMNDYLESLVKKAEACPFQKADSGEAKGVAILVMLALHLFNEPWKLELCTPMLSFGEVSLAQILGRVAGICVGLYLFLSGFGQFCIWRKENAEETPLSTRIFTGLKRVLRLYFRLWLVGGLCVALLVAFGINNFEISWGSVLGNALGWRCSFNATWWFLLPWSVVCIAAPLLFAFFFRGKNFFFDLGKIVVLTLASGGGVLLVFLHVHGKVSLPYALFQGLTALNLLPVFLLGALSAKWNLIGLFRACFHGWGWILLPGLIALHWFMCGQFSFGAVNGFWAIAFIFAFSVTPLPSCLHRGLTWLGEKSVDMWFIHAFFIAPPFLSVLYAPKYPILIFVELVLLTLATTLAFRGIFRIAEIKRLFK